VRELIVTQNITLDGVIDAAEGWFDPAGEEEVDQSDVIKAIREQMATTDALLVGRVTFEQLRGYWPHQADDVTGGSTSTSSPGPWRTRSGSAPRCCAGRCWRRSAS
jgi:dihydrofolate reductase